MTDIGDNSQNSSQPSPNVTSPKTKMKADAATSGTAMMTTSIMKATIRRASTPSNSSGFAAGS
jgi:hypothetical protein